MGELAIQYANINSTNMSVPRIESEFRPANEGSTAPTLPIFIDRLLAQNPGATAYQPVSAASVIYVFTAEGPPIILLLKPGSHADAEIDTSLTQESDFPEKLDGLKNRLSVSVTQLAELLGVTRKAVYDWHDGSAPRSSMAIRINAITGALASKSPNELKRLKSLWHVPVAGTSFISVLQNESMDQTTLTAAITSKLNELSDELAKNGSGAPARRTDFGGTNLAEYDRVGDFS